MDRLFRIDFYPQDWLIDTSRLTLEERGVYVQVVMLIYANRGPIVDDPTWIGAASNCSKTVAKNILAQLLEKGFLQKIGEKITQKRTENELKKKINHFQNSQKGGEISWGNNRKINDLEASDTTEPLATPSPSPSPSPIAIGISKDIPTHTDNLKPAREKNGKGKHELPHDFIPDAEAVKLCAELNVSLDAALTELRDWASAKRPRYHDWQATFRNSVRRSAKHGASGTRGNGGFGRQTASVVAAGARVAARYSGSD